MSRNFSPDHGISAAEFFLPYMHPGRVDVNAAGAVIWSTVLQRVADATATGVRSLTLVTTSEHDILDGVALSLALDNFSR